MSKGFNVSPILLFLFLAGILILAWFRFGLIYGGGDTGLPTYNPSVMVNIAKNIWWEALSPGIPVAQGLTSVPLLFMLSILQTLGAGPVFIQGFLFFILLFMMGYGMYLLALNIFGKASFFLAISAGVFYLFNPYMMIQIWHRFIHNAMVLVAFLPFLVLTWLFWIRKGHPGYLLLFLLVNFLAVYVFGTIAFIVAVWMLLTLLTLLEAIVPWKGKKVALKLSFTFVIGLLAWASTNSWWLIPTFSVSSALFATQHTTDDSLTTLMMLSAQTILPYLLRLINPFYLYWQADFGSIYQNIFFVSISWLFVMVVFVGFIRGLKQKAYATWSLLALILLALVKGAAPPFSFPYIFGFANFFPLGVIRNPFEKLGVLLPFVYAILFALGLQLILTTGVKYIGRFKTYTLLVVFILLQVAFFHPMFAGKLFGSIDKQNFVSVPKSYTEANEWIKQDLKSTTNPEGRILHLPLPRSEAATYNWQYGYHGVEPSAAIFTSLPSIARGLDVPQVSDALSGLSLIFHKPYASNQAVILKMLQDFSIKYIILHKDIQWRGGGLYDPTQTEEVLNKLPFIDKLVQFDDLVIYKIKDEYYSHKIIVTDKISLVSPGENSLVWPYLALDEKRNMISSIVDPLDESILSRNNQLIILPQAKFLFSESSQSASLDPQLIRIRSILIQNGEIPSEKLLGKIILANQTLIKIVNLFNGSQKNEIESLIKDYGKSVKEIFKKEISSSRLLLYVNQPTLSTIFKEHLSILEQINAFETAVFLRENLIRSDLLPVYPVSDPKLSYLSRQIFKFKIPAHARYKILMTNSKSRANYLNNLADLNFQINQQPFLLKGEFDENFISFGEVELEPGEYEISYIIPPSLNLISLAGVDESIVSIANAGQNPASLEVNLENVTGGDIYNLSFEAWVQQGGGFYLQLEQDTDSIDLSGERAFRINEFIPQNSSKWQSYNFSLPPLNLTSQKAIIRFLLPKPSSSLFSATSSVQIRNLKVERFLNNVIFLTSKLANQINNEFGGTLLEMRRQSPGQYQGKVKISKPAFFLFQETYHPGWKLKLKTSDGSLLTPDQQFLANLYGNAWLVERAGEYTFSLEFEPQESVTRGIILAVSTFIILLVLILTKKIIKHEP